MNGRKVLDGIDFEVTAGEAIAFVGPSGAGKTSICSLLPRFYDVTERTITVDGEDAQSFIKNLHCEPDHIEQMVR
jgi:ATP-binding cassette subfamily B protein